MNINYEEQLQKLSSNVNDWLKFAEAKNFGLLTLNAAVAFGFTQITFEFKAVEYAGNFVFLPLALISFFIALLSLFPVLTTIERSGGKTKKWINSISNFISSESHFENIHYYGYLKGIDVVEFETKFLTKTGQSQPFTEYENELAIQILYNARIAWIKFQLFKIGAFIFSIAVILATFSLPVFAFIKCS